MEDDSKPRNGLLAACLAWQPGGKPLEEHAAAQLYLNESNTNIKKVRLLQALLAKHRRPKDDDLAQKKIREEGNG